MGNGVALSRQNKKKLKPIKKVKSPKDKTNILDTLTEATIEDEGLIKGQTPIRDANLSKGGREAARFKNTVLGVPIDWKRWRNAPKDRKNFYYVKPKKVPTVIKRQFRNYFRKPPKYGLSKKSTLEDVIKTFDPDRPKGKLDYLKQKDIDTNKLIKNYKLAEQRIRIPREKLRPIEKVSKETLKPIKKVKETSKKKKLYPVKKVKEVSPFDKFKSFILRTERKAKKEPKGFTGSAIVSTNISDLDKKVETPKEQKQAEELTSLPTYLKYKWNKGGLTVIRGDYGKEAMYGRMPYKKASDLARDSVRKFRETHKDIKEATYENPVRKVLGETAELAPYMLDSTKEALFRGVQGGAAGLAASFLAGQAPPFTFMPEEAFTAPTALASGLSIGSTYGVIKNATDIEGGNLYLSLREQGVPHKTAQSVSIPVGVTIGIIEAAQLRHIGKPFLKAFSKNLQKPIVQNTLVNLFGRIQARGGREIAEEELQEMASIIGETIAGFASGKKKVIPTVEEIKNRTIMVAKEAGPAMALMSVPGSIVGTGMSKAKKAQMEADRVRKKVQKEMGVKIPPKGVRVKAIPEDMSGDEILNKISEEFDVNRESAQKLFKNWQEDKLGKQQEERVETSLEVKEIEKDEKYFPENNRLIKLKDALVRGFDIEAPFKKFGFPELGFKIKSYYNTIGLAQGKAQRIIEDISRVGITKPFAKARKAITGKLPKLPKDVDYTDLTFIAERPTLFKSLSQKARKKVSPYYQKIRKFYNNWQKTLKDLGWRAEFPQTFIDKRKRQIADLKTSLNYIEDTQKKENVRKQIAEYQGQIDRIRKQKIQFVSIPAKAIINKAIEGKYNKNKQRKIMSILPKWGRETITVKDLVDEGILSREEADIRKIMGEYATRMGKKVAQSRIFQEAEKQGLIQPASKKPHWQKFNPAFVPQLRGKRMHPMLNQVMTRMMGSTRTSQNVDRVINLGKMLQFYNPLFLPMYDIQQSLATGALANIKAGKYFIKGIQDTMFKNDNYWEAHRNNLFSKPFYISLNEYKKRLDRLIKDAKLEDMIDELVMPQNWVKNLYLTSWNAAWTMDQAVRMMTYNYLKEKGATPRQAAQTAATFHADYASVPMDTRKKLNRVFFTPTFKIVMGKLYNQMLKGVVRSSKRATLENKTVIDTKDKSRSALTDKIFARGAAYALSMQLAKDFYFRARGFEREQWFRRYVKEIETERGKKELVVTLSDPFNVPWRYYYKFKSVFKPSTTNEVKRAVQTFKWELWPGWRMAAELYENRGSDYKPIYNKFSDPDEKVIESSKYIASESVRVLKGLIDKESIYRNEETYSELADELSKFEATVLRPFIWPYIRDIKDRRKVGAVNHLKDAFRDYLWREKRKPKKLRDTPKERKEKLENLKKEIEKVKKELEE